MATPTSVLFIAGGVPPFVDGSGAPALLRALAEDLHDSGTSDVRLTMPRYGTITDREHHLHEVIRLSGTDIAMGETTETLTVKVASLSDFPLQVYFMDSEPYFGRDGLATDGKGAASEGNAAPRALFFARSALSTIRKLRWAPEVVHAFGWMGGLAPLLLKTEFADADVFEDARVVYTPDAAEVQADLSPAFARQMGLSAENGLLGRSLTEAGCASADAVIHLPSSTPTDGAEQFHTDADERTRQVVRLYENLFSRVAT